jgi:hypothetical protein
MALPSLSNAKDIYELVKKGATIEAQEKIMEYRQVILDLQEENINLRSIVKELEGQLSIKGQIRYDAPYYWMILEDGGNDGPFCQNCYDVKRQLIRLQSLSTGVWRCASCENTFIDKHYREQGPLEPTENPYY